MTILKFFIQNEVFISPRTIFVRPGIKSLKKIIDFLEILLFFFLTIHYEDIFEKNALVLCISFREDMN